MPTLSKLPTLIKQVPATPPPIARDRERQFFTSHFDAPVQVTKNETWRDDVAGEYQFDQTRSEVVILTPENIASVEPGLSNDLLSNTVKINLYSKEKWESNGAFSRDIGRGWQLGQ